MATNQHNGTGPTSCGRVVAVHGSVIDVRFAAGALPAIAAAIEIDRDFGRSLVAEVQLHLSLMVASPLTSTVLFHVGPVPVTRPVVTTWAIMVVLTLASLLVTRRLQRLPDRRQAALEVVVSGILRQIMSSRSSTFESNWSSPATHRRRDSHRMAARAWKD